MPVVFVHARNTSRICPRHPEARDAAHSGNHAARPAPHRQREPIDASLDGVAFGQSGIQAALGVLGNVRTRIVGRGSRGDGRRLVQVDVL